MSKEKMTVPSRIFEEMDQLAERMEIKRLLNYFRLGNFTVSRRVLKIFYIIICSVDCHSEIYKTKFEPVFVSHGFIDTLTTNILSKYKLDHPDILTGRVLVILLHICRKSDNLTLTTMETTNCLRHMLRIFIESTKLFKLPICSMRWTDPETAVFYIVWRAIPCLLNMIIADKTDINEKISPICKTVFLQAIKFIKLYVSSDIACKGWKNDLPVGVLDYINNLLRCKQYLDLFNELNAIDVFLRWLRESINGTYSGYVFKIVHSYVVDFPEEALQANIIQELFDYMARNKENICNGLYLGQVYCGLGDICRILKLLINKTKYGLISFPFEKSVNSLLIMKDYCALDCISRVFVSELIFIIRDVYRSPIIESPQSIKNAYENIKKWDKGLERVLRTIREIKVIIKDHLQRYYDFDEGEEEEEKMEKREIPPLPDKNDSIESPGSSPRSPEYDSSSSESGADDEQKIEANVADSLMDCCEGVDVQKDMIVENMEIYRDEETKSISSPEYDSDSVEAMSVQGSDFDERVIINSSSEDDVVTSKATKYLPIHLLDEALRTEIYPINSKEKKTIIDQSVENIDKVSMSTDEDSSDYDQLEQ
ncbi:uncharacterized protein isoform X2 [Rhodnius prolixus]